MTAPASRTILLHYHLFKNAGTSLDALLQEAFPGRWVTREFGAGPADAHRRELEDWITGEPEAVCFSTHTGRLPAPQPAGVRVLPVVFVRHPLDRIASAYAFERTQDSETYGAVLARHTSLAGYIATRLALPGDPQCRNFHASFLARSGGDGEGSFPSRAMEGLASLPFVGVVEDFAGSLVRLGRWLAAEGLGEIDLVPVAKNVSRDHRQSLADRIDALRQEIGADLFARLEEANETDLAIHRRAIELAAGS